MLILPIKSKMLCTHNIYDKLQKESSNAQRQIEMCKVCVHMCVCMREKAKGTSF